MRNITICFILIALASFIVGCEEAGYMVTINTNHVKYVDVQQIGKILKGKGFETMVWERKTGIQKTPMKFILFLRKN